MALRIRKTGEIYCAAKTESEEGDTYIHDGLHYQLSAIQKTIVPDVNEHLNGRWYWLHQECGVRHKDDENLGLWVAVQTRQSYLD